jgi:hypothetical protein
MTDVKIWDDLSFYLVNAISLEWHLLCSYAETKDKSYLQIAQEVRRNRAKWLDYFTKKNSSQLYCSNKHILACVGALKELSNRFQEAKEIKLSEECLEESRLYQNIFVEMNK